MTKSLREAAQELMAVVNYGKRKCSHLEEQCPCLVQVKKAVEALRAALLRDKSLSADSSNRMELVQNQRATFLASVLDRTPWTGPKHRYEQSVGDGIGFCTVCLSDFEADGNHIIEGEE